MLEKVLIGWNEFNINGFNYNKMATYFRERPINKIYKQLSSDVCCVASLFRRY